VSGRDKFILVVSLLVLVGSLAFISGIYAGYKQMWPTDLVRDAKKTAVNMLSGWGFHPPAAMVERAADASPGRIFISRDDPPMPGYRAIMGYDPDRGAWAIWLIDENGRERHKWPIDYRVYDPDGPINGAEDPHGLFVLPDGSALINFDLGDSLVRIDPCGNPIWRREGIFHHLIDRGPDGTFWTWEAETTPYAHHNFLVNFDPETGQTLRKISLVDDIIKKSTRNASIFNIYPSFEFREFDRTPPKSEDLFHPNDIEVLTADKADLFPLFDPGDIMISLRNIHLVAVIDPSDYRIKWSSSGPWRFQHDPDFTSRGTITVYDNNRVGNRSRIIEIDPNTMRWSELFDEHQFSFYSGTMGTHQHLFPDNLLVTIPDQGRVVELTAKHERAFEFNSESSDTVNAHVANGQWLPHDYFTTFPKCESAGQ
jgi:hypothetical protein